MIAQFAVVGETTTKTITSICLTNLRFFLTFTNEVVLKTNYSQHGSQEDERGTREAPQVIIPLLLLALCFHFLREFKAGIVADSFTLLLNSATELRDLV